MAILDFLNKQKEEEEKNTPEQTFAPKSMPVRGPGGKFVSKKKPIEDKKKIKDTNKSTENKKILVKDKEINENKTEGPFMAPFAGKEVRKFYFNKKWYFAVQDLIFLLAADPPFPPFEELKKKKEFKSIFEKNLIIIKEADLSEKVGPTEEEDMYIKVSCADATGSIEILRGIIKSYNASFPGSLFRWLEDISTFKFEN